MTDKIHDGSYGKGEVRKEYGLLAKKFGLPEFDELNWDFEIDKIDGKCEVLIRAVRKNMMDKIVNSSRFVEMFFTPMNLSKMYMAYANSMTSADVSRLNKIYDALSSLIIQSLELEIKSSEKAEAELVKKVYSTWNNLKGDFIVLFEEIKKPAKAQQKKDRSYFG